MTQLTDSQKESQIITTNSFEEITLPSGATILVPKINIIFKEWKGEPIEHTFGNKPLIDVNGKPVFAELAIMHLFIRLGWQSRWIETYGKNKQKPIFLNNWKDELFKNQIPALIKNDSVMSRLKKIAALNGSYSGCWDVIGWRNDKIIFAESKRSKKDRIRETQLNWLNAGLRSGLTPNNFLFVEWSF